MYPVTNLSHQSLAVEVRSLVLQPHVRVQVWYADRAFGEALMLTPDEARHLAGNLLAAADERDADTANQAVEGDKYSS